MTTEVAPQVQTQTPEQITATAELTAKNRAIDQADDAGEPTDKPEGEAKPTPEKTAEQREIERLRRGIGRKTRQLAEARAQAQFRESTFSSDERPANNRASEDDEAPLTLTRAQLAEMVNAEAAKLAPTLRDQATEAQRRTSVLQGLEKTWGKLPADDPSEYANKYDELAAHLDDAFGGLKDSSGRLKPALEAVFEADSPPKVIEWLTDHDNADEAERISKLSAVQAGKAIAKLEAKLATEAKDKPQPSKAPAPLEPVRGAGKPEKRLADLSGADFDKRRREQIAQRR